MSTFFSNYTLANMFCVIIFCILLLHDCLKKDRQEKQIKFDRALIVFILYFIVDSFYAAILDGVIPRTRFSMSVVCFWLCTLLATITYFWLHYVMAVEHVPHRNRPVNIFAILVPFIVSTIALVVIYCFAPYAIVNEKLEAQPTYNIFLTVVPCIYITAVIFYAMRRAKEENNRFLRQKHIYIAFLPVMVIVGGVLQITVFPELPIFCFSSTLLVLGFYIQFMEDQVSIDPLTKLNNRRQLMQYAAHLEGSHKEHTTYVVMIDVNDFKSINDTYGHAEGDNALILISDALRKIVGKNKCLGFLGRYGGDEFIMIVNFDREEDLNDLIEKLRENIRTRCKILKTPYTLSIGVGYTIMEPETDTLEDCIQRADKKLYIDKKMSKEAK